MINEHFYLSHFRSIFIMNVFFSEGTCHMSLHFTDIKCMQKSLPLFNCVFCVFQGLV